MVDPEGGQRPFGSIADLSVASVFGQDYVDPTADQPDPTQQPETLFYRMDAPPGLGEVTPRPPQGGLTRRDIENQASPDRGVTPAATAAPNWSTGKGGSGTVFDQPHRLPGTGFYDDSLYQQRSVRRNRDEQTSAASVPEGNAAGGTDALLQQLVGQIGVLVQTQSQILVRLSTLESQPSPGQANPPVVGSMSSGSHLLPAAMPALAPPPPPAFDPSDPAGRPLDAKWIPSMPQASWQSWKTRSEEITGFWNWLESLTGWLSLIHASFPGEIREVIGRQVPLLQDDLSKEQNQRAQRLYYILQQTFGGFHRVRNLMKVYEGETGLGSSNGYEMLRRLRQEFSLQTRSEALTVKSEVLSFKVKHYDNLLDLLRQVDAKVFHFRQLLDTYPVRAQVADIEIGDSDLYLVLLRNLPQNVREFAQLHGGETVHEVRNAVLLYHNRTKLVGDVGKVHSFDVEVKGKGKEKGKDSGKGKSKDSGKGKGGKPSRSSSRDSQCRQDWTDKCKKEGLCFKCGKTGHSSRNCPQSRSASPGGKGKGGKDPDKPKDGKKFCTNCGKKGHSTKECRKPKGSVRSMDEGESTEPEPDGESIVMTMFGYVEGEHSESPSGVVQSAELHELTSHTVAFSDGRSQPGSEWLLDSGATSHIVAQEFLHLYRVVHRHQVVRCELKAANGQLIETHGIVDVEAPFKVVEKGKASNKKFVLSRCIIASIPFSVISPFVLAKHGWGFWLDLTDKTSLVKGSLSIPLGVRERAWWAVASLKRESGPQKPPKSPKSKSDVQPMDVSTSESKVQIADQVTVVVGDPGKPPGVSSSSLVSLEDSISPGRASLKNAGTLSFLLRRTVADELDVTGFHALFDTFWCLVFLVVSSFVSCVKFFVNPNEPNPQVHVLVMSCDSEVVETCQGCNRSCSHDEKDDLDEVRIGDDDEGDDEMMDQPLPPVGEDLDDDNDDPPVEETELELGPQGLYDHVARGHQPYLSTCMACVRAQGRIPAKRLKLRRSRSVVGADFAFLKGLRFLVLVVAATGMIFGRVMDQFDSDKNARYVNQALKEIGLTGLQVELVSDGEDALLALFRSAARLPTFPGAGLHFATVGAGRHQSNGLAENSVKVLKSLASTHLLFLEARLCCKLDPSSRFLDLLLGYCSRTYNIHHVKQGSTSTALERLRGRTGGPVPRTLPFGVLALGAAVETSVSNPVEKLTPMLYLGPVHSFGGGALGILAEEGKSGIDDLEELLKLRTYKACRVAIPVVWPKDELIALGCTVSESDIPLEPLPQVDPKGEDRVDAPPSAGKSPEGSPEGALVVPASGPPKPWILSNGYTPGCTACDRIRSSGKAHSRVHNAACKARYKAWLEGERRKRRSGEREERDEEEEKRRRREGAVDISLPPVLGDGIPPPLLPSVPVSSPGLPSPAPVSSDPSVPPAVPMEVEVPDEVMDPSPPTHEPMEISELVEQDWIDEENLFLAGPEVQTEASVHWFESELLGRKIWQSFPVNSRCEVSHVPLPVDQTVEGFRKEHSQLTSLDVGDFVSEEQAKKLAADRNLKVLNARWVVTKKPDRVRCRVVCKDFRSMGLSSLREDLYSPTGSLENLRIILALSWWYGLHLATCDISTAFLYSTLWDSERQPVRLPPSTLGKQGERLVLFLKRALYGLRRAPLAWFRTMQEACLEFGA